MSRIKMLFIAKGYHINNEPDNHIEDLMLIQVKLQLQKLKASNFILKLTWPLVMA